MITALGLATLMLAVMVGDADFLARVEHDVWLDTKGAPIPRIVRDDAGHVQRLRLSGMTLSEDDMAAIAHIQTLRGLELRGTNVTAAHLRPLRMLSHLEHLNLSSTKVTDDAIEEIIELPALRTLCLGDVVVTPAAVERLKSHFAAHERRLSLGYSQRK
jgi:hypothetical protein